jgi:hypothetical protein
LGFLCFFAACKAEADFWGKAVAALRLALSKKAGIPPTESGYLKVMTTVVAVKPETVPPGSSFW